MTNHLSYQGGCGLLYARHCHTGYSIFHCDSMKYDLMFSWITMKYAVSRMKMPHIRESVTSLLTVLDQWGLFVLIWMHVLCWNQISSHNHTFFWNCLKYYLVLHRTTHTECNPHPWGQGHRSPVGWPCWVDEPLPCD